MCGISGIIYKNHTREVQEHELAAITDVIAHRGPDGFGYWRQNNVGFGHRRLSIIDLQGSAQPMKVNDRNLVLTYNGEIYNFLEIKSELQKVGFTFRTSGDTEVILKAYEYWGTDCLQKFRGMFAFAIADIKKHEVFLARDHFGIKPLIYYTGHSSFMFGSEIQQFSEHKEFKKEIDITALSEYLKLGYIPAPQTIYNNLFKLEPGNFLRVDFQGKILEHTQYFDIEFRPDYSVNYNTWVERVEEAIKTSVKYHKIADVPYGTFLSGGIDSSLIASYLADFGKNVDAFTMGFHNEEFNEVPYAKQVAKTYGLKHHIEYIDMKDMEEVFPKLVSNYGEPFADSSSIPTYYITKKIREHLPVVLSGDGGDEAFGGYYSYQNFLKIANPSAPKDAYKDQIKRMLKYVGKTYKTTPRTPNLEDWLQLISWVQSKTVSTWIKQDFHKEISDTSVFHRWYQEAQNQQLDLYSTGSYLDYKTYIHSDILTKVDIASMMNSLEVRTPLIDVEIIRLMAQIPSKYKISRNKDGSWQKKKILNTIAENRFGKAFVERKKKGFTVPLVDWFGKNAPFGIQLQQILENKDSKIFQYLNQDALKNNFKSQEYNINQLYQITVLEHWLQSQ
jgi:asparagine synthase (glutamine-hydrolysing)